ncbi:MAG TPA: peptidase [Thermoplasmata archaeon]|jgi:heat shock protein HtpX|nr:MAG TPA: peptidase [Thermoplasmata archaeon]
MWLQLRLYLLVGAMFAILYGILIGIGYYLQITGLAFYLLIIGVAAGFVLVQYAIGPKIVEWSMRVKYVNEQEYPKLHQMVAELAEKAGLPNKPKIGISQLPIPNAFAFGRTKKGSRVCVTKGLLDLLNEDELKAVLGHELSHIKHRDVAVITILSVIPMICYMIYITFLWGGIGRRDRDSGGAIAIGILALVVYFITSLLVMYGSRIREYYADQGSAELGNQPHHLATALYKLTVSTARTPKQALKQTEGMKAFFINDPSRAMYEVRELKDIDLDMSGTIDQNELMMLSTKKISLKTGDKILEVLSTHPNVVKRIKHLASLSAT